MYDTPELLPPFSIEAEQSVLGALLSDPECIDKISFLETAHFYRQDHRNLFDEIRKLAYAGQQFDAIMLFERMTASKTVGEMTMQYMAQLRFTEPSGARVRNHADIIVEKAKRRQVISLMDEVSAAMYNGATEVKEVVDFMVTRAEALLRTRHMQDPQRMIELMTAYADVIDQRYNGSIRPVSTGLEDLDDKLGGGFDIGTLNIIAGRPGMGKTAMGLGIARHNATIGETSLFQSMEMERFQVIDRNVSAMAQIPLSWLRKPDMTGEHWPGITKAIQQSQDMNLFIDDQTALNMMAIRAKARKVKRSAGSLRALVIDQLSFITGSKLERRTEQVGEYTRGLVALAKELECAVILLCQLNRKCEDRPNKRPIAADLAESGAIEQDADSIVFLYRDEVYNEHSPDKGTAEAIIAKKRQGTPGTARLAYIGEQTRFANLHKGWMPNVTIRENRSRHSGFD